MRLQPFAILSLTERLDYLEDTIIKRNKNAKFLDAELSKLQFKNKILYQPDQMVL